MHRQKLKLFCDVAPNAINNVSLISHVSGILRYVGTSDLEALVSAEKLFVCLFVSLMRRTLIL